MRALALLSLSGVVACGGGDDATRGLGQRADAMGLAAALDVATRADSSAIAIEVAETVRAACGPACDCLRSVRTEAAPACPAANPSVPPSWPPMELAGHYLGEQLAHATEPARGALVAAMAALRVPISRIDPARWTLAPAARSRRLSATRTLVGVDHEGGLWVGAMPVARFDARGARIDDGPAGTTVATPEALAAALGALRGPPAAPIAPDAIDVDGGTHGTSAGSPDTDLTGTDVPDLPPGGFGLGLGVGVGRHGGGGGLDSGFVERASAAGTVGAALAHDAPIVAADGAAPAIVLVQVLEQSGGAIAIRTADAIAEQPIAYRPDGGGSAAYELTRTRDLLVLVIGNAPAQRWPITGGRYDVDAVKAALTAALAGRIDVVALVASDVTAAALIDTIDLAIQTGARHVRILASRRVGGGLGTPGASIPMVNLGQPQAMGHLDQAIVRRYVQRNRQKIAYCYQRELLTKPSLAGTVQTQFFITPRGDVASVSATGVDADVARCIAAVIKAIEFPRPTGGGGVKVNYPFTFHNANP